MSTYSGLDFGATVGLIGETSGELEGSISNLLSITGNSPMLDNLLDTVKTELGSSGINNGASSSHNNWTEADYKTFLDVMFDIDESTKQALIAQYNDETNYQIRERTLNGQTIRSRSIEQVEGIVESEAYGSIASNLILKREGNETFIIFPPEATEKDVDSIKDFLNTMFGSFASNASNDSSGAFRLKVGSQFAWDSQRTVEYGGRASGKESYDAANLLNPFKGSFENSFSGLRGINNNVEYGVMQKMQTGSINVESLQVIETKLDNIIDLNDKIGLKDMSVGVAEIQKNEAVNKMASGVHKAGTKAVQENAQTLKSG